MFLTPFFPEYKEKTPRSSPVSSTAVFCREAPPGERSSVNEYSIQYPRRSIAEITVALNTSKSACTTGWCSKDANAPRR